MKKTIIALLALGGIAMGDETIHGVTFDTDITGKAYQNFTPAKSNLYVTAGKNSWGGSDEIQGLRLENGASMRFNTAGKDVSIKYLSLDGDFSIDNSTDQASGGKLVWNNTANKLKLNMTAADGWIDLTGKLTLVGNSLNMTDGTIYLNKTGRLDLGEKGTLGADVDVNYTLSFTSHDLKQDLGNNLSLVTVTLMTGDFSAWKGKFTVDGGAVTDMFGTTAKEMTYDEYAGIAMGLTEVTTNDIGKYTIMASDTGLTVTYVIPEPTTATLSLLALAGLAARRRRK